jgi:hypothetical protein
MTLCAELKEQYLKEVEALISSWKGNSARLAAEGSNDEAILETIKANIGDIFYKMFNVSYNKSCGKSESEDTELGKLSETYLAFFDKIPAPWREKMAKDKEHHMVEEYYKEKIKLETAEQIKNLFIKYYDGYCKEAKA